MTDTTTIIALVAAGVSANGLWMWAMWRKARLWSKIAWAEGYRDCLYWSEAEEAAERSRRVSKGNRTRYAKRRARLDAKTAELKGIVE